MSAHSGTGRISSEGGELAGRERLAGESECFHRTAELERLRAALHGLRQGRPARWLIQGEGGIGKSRVIAEAISGDEHGGVAIYTGRAHDFERERQFGVLIDALGPQAHAGDPGTAGRLVRTGDPDLPEARHDLIPRIVTLIDRACLTRPVGLILEDMQWADPMSAAALLRALDQLADRPLGVFMTLRALPSNPAVDHLIDQARPEFGRIVLDGLVPHDVGALVRSITGGEPGPQLTGLLDGTGGNPSMVIALIKGLGEMQALSLTDGVVETDSTLPPRSMWPQVMARFARQSDSCQNLLTVAAVFGAPFAVGTLATAAERSVFGVLTDLREAIAGGILTEIDGVLWFRHELVRVILFEETPASVRSELQRRIAEILPRTTWRERSPVPRRRGDSARRRDDIVPAMVPPGWERATRAEREVVRHVVNGLSNREIGKLLFVSARTVETHLSHVNSKLGVNSRVELTSLVMRSLLLRAALAQEPESPSHGNAQGIQRED